MMIALILGSWVGLSVLCCVAIVRVAAGRHSDEVSVIEVPPAEDISFTPEVSQVEITPIPSPA